MPQRLSGAVERRLPVINPAHERQNAAVRLQRDERSLGDALVHPVAHRFLYGLGRRRLETRINRQLDHQVWNLVDIGLLSLLAGKIQHVAEVAFGSALRRERGRMSDRRPGIGEVDPTKAEHGAENQT